MKGAIAMSPDELRSNAKAYLDDITEIQGGSPSNEDYEAAVSRVEAETRKLLAIRRHDADQVAVVC
jgi:hypothetical protein